MIIPSAPSAQRPAPSAQQRRSLSRAMRWSLSQASPLLVLTAIVTASGLWDWLDARTKIRWHAISSLILIAVIIRHTWTRRGWLLRRRPARSSAARPDEPASDEPASDEPASDEPAGVS